MKNLFLTLILCISTCQVQAQRTVNLNGQIKNLNPGEIIYLGIEDILFKLNVSQDGTFAVDKKIDQKVSFFYFAKISKRGKIERQTPQIWFDGDNIVVTLNWTDKSFQLENILPFQSISEKIELLKGKQQISYLLSNPNSLPSLFFANENKEKIPLLDLEKFSKSISKEYINSIYLKRIENYLAAKKREPLKKGKKVEDFKLPNKEGKHISVIQDL